MVVEPDVMNAAGAVGEAPVSTYAEPTSHSGSRSSEIGRTVTA
jgi:hypothetical protein